MSDFEPNGAKVRCSACRKLTDTRCVPVPSGYNASDDTVLYEWYHLCKKCEFKYLVNYLNFIEHFDE